MSYRVTFPEHKLPLGLPYYTHISASPESLVVSCPDLPKAEECLEFLSCHKQENSLRVPTSGGSGHETMSLIHTQLNVLLNMLY